MRVALPLIWFLVFSTLAFLAHAVVLEKQQKAVELIRVPRFLQPGSPLGFGVRIRGARDEDRFAFAMLCAVDGPCSLKEFQHERISYLPIEGSAAQKFWQVPQWTHLPPGEYAAVAGLGAFEQIRVVDSVGPIIVLELH